MSLITVGVLAVCCSPSYLYTVSEKKGFNTGDEWVTTENVGRQCPRDMRCNACSSSLPSAILMWYCDTIVVHLHLLSLANIMGVGQRGTWPLKEPALPGKKERKVEDISHIYLGLGGIVRTKRWPPRAITAIKQSARNEWMPPSVHHMMLDSLPGPQLLAVIIFMGVDQLSGP